MLPLGTDTYAVAILVSAELSHVCAAGAWCCFRYRVGTISASVALHRTRDVGLVAAEPWGAVERSSLEASHLSETKCREGGV